ncbi:MAG: hypothetical protein R2748_30685 [Bryobacterales bacterium]
MPRLYFTGRKKISQEQIAIEFRPGRPPRFTAELDLSRNRLPPDAKVVVEAYHNTLLQRFDFGTVADCRPRDANQLSAFGEWDQPRFRVRVVDVGRDPGRILASCERVAHVEPNQGGEGGRSLLKLFPRPDAEMGGELWRVESISGSYQLAYNKDAAGLEKQIKGMDATTLGLILPAAMREILARELLWESIGADEGGEWVALAQTFSGEPVPRALQAEPPTRDDVAAWIESAVQAFCRDRGRFVERMVELEKCG